MEASNRPVPDGIYEFVAELFSLCVCIVGPGLREFRDFGIDADEVCICIAGTTTAK